MNVLVNPQWIIGRQIFDHVALLMPDSKGSSWNTAIGIERVLHTRTVEVTVLFTVRTPVKLVEYKQLF